MWWLFFSFTISVTDEKLRKQKKQERERIAQILALRNDTVNILVPALSDLSMHSNINL